MLTITEAAGVRTVAVKTHSGALFIIGEIIAADDGEFVWFAADSNRFLRAWTLREIVRELDRLNLEKEMKRPAHLSIHEA